MTILYYTSRRWHSFITTPIFYANAAPHIGHLYTALLADVSFRWSQLQTKGYDTSSAIFSSGTDEHGIKIQTAAQLAKSSPKEFCDHMSGKFEHLLRHFGIFPTDFIRTTEKRHKIAVEHFWEKLKSGGFLYKDVYSGWYSTVDECFYSKGDTEVNTNGVTLSKATGSTLEWVSETNYLFRMAPFRDRLQRWLQNSDVISPSSYLPYTLPFLDFNGDLSVSRDRNRLKWGISVPEDESQTIYVWLDALINYLTFAGYPEKLTSWPPDCQIIGKDILKFHALYWPAFLMAADLELPKKLFVHGHWLVDNVKMSKSVGNVVDPFLAGQKLTIDGLRYFLLRQATMHDNANFNFEKATNLINSELSNTIGNLISRVTSLNLNPRQIYPEYDEQFLNGELHELGSPLIYSTLNELADKSCHYVDSLLVSKAIGLIISAARQANTFLHFHRPWSLTDSPQRDTVLYVALETARICAILLNPITPTISRTALDRLAIPNGQRTIEFARFYHDGRLSGRKFGQNSPVFPRVTKESN